MPLGLVLGDTISLLQPPGEFRSLPFNHVKIVVGELTPLQLHLAFELREWD